MPKWDFTQIKSLIRQKAATEDRKLTYEIIALEIGVSKATVDRYANRPVISPDLNVVWRFCEYFDVEVDYFLAEEDESPGNQKGRPAYLGSPSAVSAAQPV